MSILGRTFSKSDMRRVIWTAGAAALAAYPTLILGLRGADKKAAILAFIIVVVAAAWSALKNWFLSDDSPIK